MLQRIDRFMELVFRYCPGVIAWPVGIAVFLVVFLCTAPNVFVRWRNNF